MIPHPTTAAMLREHGSDRAGRQAARARLIEIARQWAEDEVRRHPLGLSMNCQEDIRRGVPPESHRCRNDGSGCLCECHDPVEATDV